MSARDRATIDVPMPTVGGGGGLKELGAWFSKGCIKALKILLGIVVGSLACIGLAVLFLGFRPTAPGKEAPAAVKPPPTPHTAMAMVEQPWKSNHTVPTSLLWPGDMTSYIDRTQSLLSTHRQKLWLDEASPIAGRKTINPCLVAAYEDASATNNNLRSLISSWNEYQTQSGQHNQRAMASYRSLRLYGRPSSKGLTICGVLDEARYRLQYVYEPAKLLHDGLKNMSQHMFDALEWVREEWYSLRIGTDQDRWIHLQFKKGAHHIGLADMTTTRFESSSGLNQELMTNFTEILFMQHSLCKPFLKDIQNFIEDIDWIDSYLTGIQAVQDCGVRQRPVDSDGELEGWRTARLNDEDVINYIDIYGVRSTHIARSKTGGVQDED